MITAKRKVLVLALVAIVTAVWVSVWFTKVDIVAEKPSLYSVLTATDIVWF